MIMSFEADYIKIDEYAKRMSIHPRTAYRRFHKGLIDGIQDERGSIRLKNPFKEYSIEEPETKRAVLYARVSSSQNKGNLDSQMERLRQYATLSGYNVVKEVEEIGSGLNEDRGKLNALLSKDINSFDYIIVEHKDRLTRFGFNYIKMLLQNANKDVVIVNEVVEEKEDLIEDFVSIIASFCARIYGNRRVKRKTEKIIKELVDGGNEGS